MSKKESIENMKKYGKKTIHLFSVTEQNLASGIMSRLYGNPVVTLHT